MKGVGGEGRWDDPLVMRLVQVLVDQRMVKPAMDPVDGHVGEEQEAQRGEYSIPQAMLAKVPVKTRIATNLEK